LEHLERYRKLHATIVVVPDENCNQCIYIERETYALPADPYSIAEWLAGAFYMTCEGAWLELPSSLLVLLG